MSGWRFFGYLKLFTVEHHLTENSLNSHFLLTGGDWRLSGGKRTSLDG